jgi:thioredoxin-dependent peroxiredoxin
VIGISVDSPSRNKAFAQALGVGFPILSDEGKTVSQEYGVLMPVIRLAKRTTFVIDKDGVIQHIDKGGEAADPGSARQACSLLGHQSQK